MAGKQHRREDDGDKHRPGQGSRSSNVEFVLPQQCCADSDAGCDRGRERDRVVGVDDAVGEAENQCGYDQPAAPQDERGPCGVGARRAPSENQAGHQADHRGRQQPRNVQAHSGAKQTAPPDVVVEVAEAAGLLAGQAAETVVAQC